MHALTKVLYIFEIDESINDNIVPAVAGTVSGTVLMILIILAICVGTIKRKKTTEESVHFGKYSLIIQSFLMMIL